MAYTREGERYFNECALWAKYGNRKPLTMLEGEPEQNPKNYDQKGIFITSRKPKPAEVLIYKGLMVTLTQNVRKDDDYVNGMQAKVLSFAERENGG
eukprot:7275621-Karenia_brevis.AAC.1